MLHASHLFSTTIYPSTKITTSLFENAEWQEPAEDEDGAIAALALAEAVGEEPTAKLEDHPRRVEVAKATNEKKRQ